MQFLDSIVLVGYRTPNLKHFEVVSTFHPARVYKALKGLNWKSISLIQRWPGRDAGPDADIITFNSLKKVISYIQDRPSSDPFKYIKSPSLKEAHIIVFYHYHAKVYNYFKNMAAAFPRLNHLTVTDNPMYLGTEESVDINIVSLAAGTFPHGGTPFSFDELFQCLRFPQLKRLKVYNGGHQPKMPVIKLNAPNLEEIHYTTSEHPVKVADFAVMTSGLPSLRKLKAEGDVNVIYLPDIIDEEELEKIQFDVSSVNWQVQIGSPAALYISDLRNSNYI